MTRAHLCLEPLPFGAPLSAHGLDRDITLLRSPPSWARAIRAFIDQFLIDCVSAGDEAQALLELSIAVTGRETIRAIGERLLYALDCAEFEAEVRQGPDMALVRLRRLNSLKVRIEASTLNEETRAEAATILARLETLIHADAELQHRAERALTETSPEPASESGWR